MAAMENLRTPAPADRDLSVAFTLDRESILARLGGDEEIYQVMVDMFLQDYSTNCTALAQAVAARDSVALSREAHTVKSLLAMFSDEAGAAHAFSLEVRAKGGQIAGLEQAVSSLQRRLREVAAVLGA